MSNTSADNRSTAVALVAGSTGYVGQAVVGALCERGITTIAHIRPGSSKLDRLSPALQRLGASVDTSAWDVDALTKTISRNRVTHVFLLIGTTRKQASAEGIEGDIFEHIDLRLTSMLIEAAAQQATPPRFVYLSSIGANPTARSKYLGARGKAEAKLIASGLSHIIARPSFITGADRDEPRPAERIGAAIADGALSVAGVFGGRKLQKKYQSTSASELAQRLIDHALGQGTGVFEGPELLKS